jgi:hypothetical protein
MVTAESYPQVRRVVRGGLEPPTFRFSGWLVQGGVGVCVLHGVPVKDDSRWSEADEVAHRQNLVRAKPFLTWFVQCPAASDSDRRALD